MYLTYNKKYWAIDIEGDALPSTKLWCACCVNIISGEEVSLVGEAAIKEWFEEKIGEGSKFIAHNMLGYDGPTLNHLLKLKLSLNMIIDTMVLSMLYSPSITGGHGLEAWGKRFRFPKGKFTDFSRYTPEMLTYCMQDARICRRIFIEIIKRMNKLKFTEVGLELEHKSWSLIKQQQKNGFAFDMQGAHSLYAILRQKENELRDRIHEFWPPELQKTGTFKKPKKQDGTYSANYLRHVDEYELVEIREHEGEYDCFEYVAFNIGSPPQRIEKLLELGWEPKEFTKKTPKGGGGNPQPTIKGQLSPSLQKFVEESGRPEPRLIADWIEINSRANMINTWMEAYNEQTGAIHGSLWLANTLRYRHSNPNTANIPAVRFNDEGVPRMGADGVYTYEARDLWTTRDSITRSLVGTDAKGIQLRVLAHYLNNKEFTEAVLAGDPHSYNQEIGGFRSRPIAKTFIYAFLLGAGDAKVGEIIGGSTKDGREVKARFIGNFPGLAELLADLERQVERTGRIVLCDGTPIIVSQPHTRLGYLLQGDESRIMKKAAIEVALENRRRNLDVIKVGDIHDEWQNDVHNEHVEEFVSSVCPNAFKASGEFFNYNLPIACDSKVGLTWAETH